MFLLRFLLIAVVVSCANIEGRATVHAAPIPDEITSRYQKWLYLPLDELVKRGREFLYVKNNPDSALVCFSIAASRYNESLSLKEKEDIFKAYTGKWYAQFFHFYDYPKAYESLLEAKKISEDIGTGKGIASFNLAMMYQVFGVDGQDNEALQKSNSYLLQSFKNAVAEKDTNVVHLAFSNLVSSANGKAELEKLKPYVRDYEKFNSRNKDKMVKFNTLLYSINLAIANGRYDDALKLLDQQRQFISPGQPRYDISNLMARSLIYKLRGDYGSAEKLLYDAEEMARSGQMKDVLLNIYDARNKMYKQQGDYDRFLESYHDYLSLKDTLLNYRQISGFNQIHFLSEMEKMDDTLVQMEYKRQIQSWIIFFCVLACLILVGFLIIILRKNRKLGAANMSLYKKNKELLEKEEQEGIMRVEMPLESEKKSQQSASSLMDKEKRDAIMMQISEAVIKSEEIYSPKFTISKFSEIVEVPAKQLSQVINECTGDNFNAFINRQRIKRACHMLDDIENYGGYTIENIGQNVGFRSRTAFISSFKKMTGLTPSDYLRAAKQARINQASTQKE